MKFHIHALIALVVMASFGGGRCRADEAIKTEVNYSAANGIYAVDMVKSPLKMAKGEEKTLNIEYPQPTVSPLFVSISPYALLDVSLSEDGVAFGPLLRIKSPGDFIPGSEGKKRLFLKLASPGSVQVVGITADCGKSRGVLEKTVLPAVTAGGDDVGAVNIVEGEKVSLHPTEFYYAVSQKVLSGAEMKAWSRLDNRADLFSVDFLLDKDAQAAAKGSLTVRLPKYADISRLRVLFQYGTNNMFGLPQPADSIRYNDEAPLIPSESGWAPGSYRKMKEGDIMLVSWKELRSHIRPTGRFTMHNPCSFKGRALYEYMSADGQWKTLPASTWISCPIPADASKKPFQVRVTCLGDTDKGSFSSNAMAFIEKRLLSEDDYYLPVNNGDGRGNPLAGWGVAGLKADGEYKLLTLNYALAADGNPLMDINEGNSNLLNPGNQVRLRIEARPAK